ncbi:phage portal protein [Streptomyces beihaiensis]|uniref:Phage portal protein n=1 Tax=Streptomyces beihaiensis TaxID=2984495 RepID=A0ABT3U6G0_9ACTN|nr:phage portal protein [Streptomyces beihaiensis]MCX3064212.1 phage portal protein [Streptomyces beihaiensis]
MKWWPRRAPRRDDDAGPVLVGDVWMDARGRPRSSWRATARATWGRRLGFAVRGMRQAGAWLAGVESRGAIEKRAITSVPWNQGGPTASGGAVTVDRVLRLAPVYAAGRLLASNLASAPLRQFRETSDGVQLLPLSSLFNGPSSQGNLNDWMWRAVLSMVYRGNAVGYITARDYLGYPTMVEWLPMDWVQVVDSMPYGRGSFVNPIWYVLGHEVDPVDLVHIPWFTLPGKILGLSPIGAFASMATTSLAAQEYMEAWHATGGVPPGTFKNTAKKVDQAEAAVIKQRLVQAIKTRQPIVHGTDWDYTAITVPAYEAQFIATLKLGATQLAAIYGVPPELIGGETGGSMSYSSPQQREIELIQFTLLPWMSKLESHLSMLTPRGQCVKFDADALVRLDPLTRWSIHEKKRLIGAANIDEIRNDEHRPPLPNGQGQDYTPLPIAAGVSVRPPTIRGGFREVMDPDAFDWSRPANDDWPQPLKEDDIHG